MTVLGLDISVYFINLSIAIPTFLLLRWTLKKKVKSESRRIGLTWIGTLVLTPIIYVGLALMFLLYISYYPTRDFDQEAWHRNVDKRYEMSGDIINRELLIGMTKPEVQELLGDDYYTYNENHWAYELGHVPGLLNIDPDVLDIYFEEDKVVKVDQHES